MTHWRYHCRGCGAHTSSLEAFDAHREGPAGSDRACSFPTQLVELIGVCEVSDPEAPKADVTVYAAERAQGARRYFRGIEGAQTAPVERKTGSGVCA
jgi:hypothetical protein